MLREEPTIFDTVTTSVAKTIFAQSQVDIGIVELERSVANAIDDPFEVPEVVRVRGDGHVETHECRILRHPA